MTRRTDSASPNCSYCFRTRQTFSICAYLKKTMSEPKGVFDGLKWTPVIATEGKVKPIPPVEDGDGTVFISIPSYRGR
jgi:hypothetical protein